MFIKIFENKTLVLIFENKTLVFIQATEETFKHMEKRVRLMQKFLNQHYDYLYKLNMRKISYANDASRSLGGIQNIMENIDGRLVKIRKLRISRKVI